MKIRAIRGPTLLFIGVHRCPIGGKFREHSTQSLEVSQEHLQREFARFNLAILFSADISHFLSSGDTVQ